MTQFNLSNISKNYFWLFSLSLAVLGWIVALGALSALQANTDRRDPQAPISLSIDWWNLWMEFFIIIGVTLGLLTSTPARPALYGYRFVYIAFLVLSLCYITFQSTVIRTIIASASSSSFVGRASAYLAGLVIKAMVWVAWIFALGSEPNTMIYDIVYRSLAASGLSSAFENGGNQAPINLTTSATQIPLSTNASVQLKSPSMKSTVQPHLMEQQRPESMGISSNVGSAIAPLSAVGPSPAILANPVRDSQLTVPSLPSMASTGLKAKSLYNYVANPDDPNEISFEKGEIFEVLDNKGKWWQVAKSNGQVGIAPSNYLQLLQN